MSPDDRRSVPFHTLMAELMRRARVDKSSIIRVTGRGGLAALLWFCRHGYDQVGYVRRGPCPGEACDLLLVLHPETDLADTLAHGPHLRDGGVLVVQGTEDEAIAPVLDRCGYRVEQRLHNRRRDLHVARRQPLLRQAA